MKALLFEELPPWVLWIVYALLFTVFFTGLIKVEFRNPEDAPIVNLLIILAFFNGLLFIAVMSMATNVYYLRKQLSRQDAELPNEKVKKEAEKE